MNVSSSGPHTIGLLAFLLEATDAESGATVSLFPLDVALFCPRLTAKPFHGSRMAPLEGGVKLVQFSLCLHSPVTETVRSYKKLQTDSQLTFGIY